MTHKKIILILLLFLGIFNSQAQNSDLSTDNKKALKHYRNAEYSFNRSDLEASKESLNEAVHKDPEFIEAWLFLGDVYNELDNYIEAINSYNHAINISPYYFPYAYYIIGNLEFKLGNYKTALDNYNSYLTLNSLSKEQINNARKKIRNTELALSIINNPLDIHLVNLGKTINSQSDEYINFVDERMENIYLTRKEANPNYHIDGNPFKENFYFSSFIKNNWDSIVHFALPIKESLNIGGMNFSIDRRNIYFTGCSWPNSYGSCDLFKISHIGNSWGNPDNLGNNINSKYWDSQPILSSDGKVLYFASKRSGGFGGSDLWMSRMQEDGNWGPPINMGDSINTAGNEMAPYIHADTKTLYFSSDTHAGLGGYDLFISRKRDKGIWSNAENLESPVNSKENEINIFINIDASKAWISSDRAGGYGGFDIYEFDTEISMKPEKIVFVKGIVIDKSNKEPLSAVVELTNLEKSESVINLQSDPVNGNFFIPIYPGVDYAFNISKRGYLFYSENLNFKDTFNLNSIEKTFELVPIQQGSSVVLKNIFFDFDSDSLKSTSYPELGQLTDLLISNPGINIQINGHTDNVGTEQYNIELSEKRAKSVYNYLIENEISPSRLYFKGYGANKPVESNDTPEGRAANRRTEIEVL